MLLGNVDLPWHHPMTKLGRQPTGIDWVTNFFPLLITQYDLFNKSYSFRYQ